MMNYYKKGYAILVVDDNVVNLQVIGNFLKSHSFKIHVATNAVKALEILEKTTPDLILLDVIMPDIDGFQLADKIKGRDELKEIPIIFLTARNSEEDIIEGFKHGGVDYIVKPFNQDELLLRVENHIQLKISKDIINRKNIELENLIKEKNELLGIAAHDLKNPLTSIQSYLSIIRNQELTDNERHTFYNFIESNVNRTISIIKDLIEVNAVEDGSINLNNIEFNVNDLLYSLTEIYKAKCDEKNIELIFTYEKAITTIYGDKDRTLQIFDNLVSNALKFSPKGTQINLKSSVNEQREEIIISVSDQGPGFTDEDKERIYSKFSKLSAKPTNHEQSTGLGLFIVQKLVHLLDGTIKLISFPSHGSTFLITLPMNLKK